MRIETPSFIWQQPQTIDHCIKHGYIHQLYGTPTSCILCISNGRKYQLSLIDVNTSTAISTSTIVDTQLVGIHPIDQNTTIAVDTEGHINVWDNRQSSSLLQHHVIDNDSTMVIRSSTLSSDSRLLIIGTELSESQMDDNNDRDSDSDDDEGSSAILFIDMRQYQMMGSYFESHSDSINCLASHPNNHDRLMSGGADSLVNWFDLSQPNESDALIQTYRVQSSLNRIGWMIESGSLTTRGYAVTDDNRWLIFNIDNVDGSVDVIHEKSGGDGRFVVDAFGDDANRRFILECDANGRVWIEDSDGVETTVEEHIHDDLIKSIHYDRESQMLFTGDDAGRVIGRRLIVDHHNQLSNTEQSSSSSRKRRTPNDQH